MKQLLIIITCIAILNTSCTQSSTTPTTPPATTNPCGYGTISNEFIELNINGLNLRSENLTASGNIMNTVKAIFSTDTTTPPSRKLSLIAQAQPCLLNSSVTNNMNFSMNIYKLTNALDPIGVYTGSSGNGYIEYYKGIMDVKRYNIDSITVLVNTCNADYVSGTFTGTAIENNTNILYPFTGSFNNLQRNGF
jgi:hypothetical protein